jgi:hypothetical protein
MGNEHQQVFYSRAYIYFGIAFLVTIAGFFPSYFGRLFETGAAHHFHGITASLWMLLLVVQPILYKLNRIDLHRKLGLISFLLVPLIVIGGLIMVHYMLNDDRYPGNLAYQLGFIDFFVIIQFLLFYILAIKNVRDIQYHARYMACTIFGPLIPALTRLWLNTGVTDSFSLSLHISYFVIEAVIILLLIDDYRKGKVRLPYVLALVLMVIQHIMMHFASGWSWWQWLMNLYAGV